MPLTQPAPSAWRVAVTRPVQWEVRRVDRVLDLTFPPPIPNQTMADPLGRVPGGSLRRAVIVDTNVLPHYGDKIRAYLDRHDIRYRIIPLDCGERHKTMRTALRLCRQLDDWGLDRFNEPLLVFAGGTGKDTAGVAGHLYRRGIRRIVYATTGVAGVDAAIALKQAVDFHGYKNRLGAYDPDTLDIVDRTFFATLPRRRHSDALAEITKLGLAVDARLFQALQVGGRLLLDEAWQGLTPDGDSAATEILDTAIDDMLGELEPNPWEDDAARPAYAGHTWSPGVEMAALRASRRVFGRRPALLHGEAVALDLLLSSGIARGRGHLSDAEYHQVAALLDTLELPTWDSLLTDAHLMAASLADTVRHRGHRQLVPLPNGIGKVLFANDITTSEIDRALDMQRRLCGRSLA